MVLNEVIHKMLYKFDYKAIAQFSSGIRKCVHTYFPSTDTWFPGSNIYRFFSCNFPTVKKHSSWVFWWKSSEPCLEMWQDMATLTSLSVLLLCNLEVKSDGLLWGSVLDCEPKLKMVTEETARKTVSWGGSPPPFHTVSFYGFTPWAAV